MTSRSDDITHRFRSSTYQGNSRVEQAQQNQADSPHDGSDGGHSIVFGEMARLIESFDWSRSPLGPSAQWPQSLKTALSICLRSRFQLGMFWGPELVFLYNDAEREVIGSLHPYALGKPAREVLVDMWETVGPMLHKVLKSGEATWSVDQPLMIDRYGLVEEGFFTWSYSPIPDDDGDIGGILLVTEETTQRVLAERRLRTLTEMAAEIASAQTAQQACATAIGILGQNPADIPCAILYLLDATGSVSLCASTGTNAHPRERMALDEVNRQRGVIQLDNLAGFFDAEIVDQLPRSAIILPILASDLENLAGFLVVGVSDHRRLDTAYRNFFDLVAARIGATIASTRAREQERARLNAIAELDHVKTAFFTNISHEFRTPLTLILGVVDDILAKIDPELRGSKYEELSVVRRNGARLLRLVNALLDVSAVEAGRVRATYRPTDLAAFTKELGSCFRSIMEKAQLTFRVESHTLPEPVYVDPEMWERIVLNLLSNAFKYTFQGEVAVDLRCVGDCAQLVVKDTGIGIQPEELPRIFERFHRVEDARGRTHEGTGIGLALVQELVKLHGGSIRAESVPGEGTTFVVSIPFGKKHLPPDRVREERSQAPVGLATGGYAEEAQRWLLGIESTDTSSQVETHVPSSIGDRPLILVADDNADMRDYLRSLLNDRYTVETVPDGEQALAAIERRKPILVLADVMMPRLDGFSLLRKLRADPETQSIPVIMVSARAGKDEIVEGMEQSADDYLEKPFNSRELLARVQSHIELARIRRETAERERKLRAEADSQRALLETVLNQMPAGVVIAKAPSGEVLLANNQAAQILQRSVGELRSVGEYSQYQIFRLDGRAYSTQEQPLARSILNGEVVMGEELRYLRPDGIFRVLFTNSAPVRDETGAIVASVVTFQDITELRLAQEELLRQSNNVIHDLAGKLITAQEEERRRVARDLHDDVAQRIALLSSKMHILNQSLPPGIAAVEELSDIQKEVEQVSESIRLISHQLHTSTLILGLPRALEGYCHEFSQQRGIQVKFTQEGSMVRLPEPVPLVMFRVLQEALYNVARHSEADQVEVSLIREGDEIRLRVKDRGKGFDPMQVSDGLGLVSMRERLRLVDGKIKLSSAPGLGTEIEATAPVSPPHSSAKIPA
jgi:signal transduction histidine kinase/FixJ family two-component response regulator